MRGKRINFGLLAASAALAGLLGAGPALAGAYGTPMKGSENSQARVTQSDSDNAQSSASVTTGDKQTDKLQTQTAHVPRRADKPAARPEHHATKTANRTAVAHRGDRKIAHLTPPPASRTPPSGGENVPD